VGLAGTALVVGEYRALVGLGDRVVRIRDQGEKRGSVSGGAIWEGIRGAPAEDGVFAAESVLSAKNLGDTWFAFYSLLASSMLPR
jgi:hypothetical protein